MTNRYETLLACLAIVGASVVVNFAERALFAMPPFEPKAQLVYCDTGAGPVIVSGFDIQYRINPAQSHIHELVWRSRPSAVRNSASLQPPIDCKEWVGGRARQ